MATRIEPTDLRVEQAGDAHVLVVDGVGELLTHVGGHLVSHEAPGLIEHIRSEFMAFPEVILEEQIVVEPLLLSGYTLLGVQKEYVARRTDNLTEDFAHEVSIDPVFTRLAGPEYIDQLARYGPLTRWLRANGGGLVDLDFVDLEDRPAPFARDDRMQAAFEHLVDFLWATYQQLDDVERTGVVSYTTTTAARSRTALPS